MEESNRLYYAIVVLVLVAVVYFYLRDRTQLFSSGILTPNACQMGQMFLCTTSLSENGIIVLIPRQTRNVNVYAVAMGCNTDPQQLNSSALTSRMVPPRSLVLTIGPFVPNVTGRCYSSTTPLNAPYGSTFTGYIFLNFTTSPPQNATLGKGLSTPTYVQYGSVTQKVGCSDTISCLMNLSLTYRLLSSTS